MIWNRTSLKIFFACFYDSIILKVLFSHKKPIILLLQVSKFWKTHPPSPAAHCSFMIDISPFCSPFFLYYKKSKNQKSITHFYFWYLSCLLWKTLFLLFFSFSKALFFYRSFFIVLIFHHTFVLPIVFLFFRIVVS